jgi:hypothetical protein
VERSRTTPHKVAGPRNGVSAVVGLTLEVALEEPNDMPAAQVDRGQDLEAQLAPVLSPW